MEVLSIKMLKKIDFSKIRLKIFEGFGQTQSIFQTVIQDMQKMPLLPWAQHHSLESQEV